MTIDVQTVLVMSSVHCTIDIFQINSLEKYHDLVLVLNYYL